MLNITFAINGRPVSADNIGDAIQAAMLAAVEEHVRSKLDGIRDPDTGEFPVVAVHGRDLENLSFTVSGSPKLVELVKSAFASSEPEESMTEPAEPRTPCAFICHSSKDAELARRVATDFRTQGIETFFAEWDIGPGDSIRQKIDAGLEQCTHFVALLTPASINAPWVKTEMDAAFMRKVEGKCRFIALRHGLAVASLPPLLIGMYAPEIKDYDADVKGLINFVHGVTEKPPLGAAPRPIAERSKSSIGLSPAAELLARLMIERSQHGDTFDPQLDGNELRALTQLPDDDIVDAVDELKGRGFVSKHDAMNCPPLGFFIGAESNLFAELDQHFMTWNPAEDAMRLAVELMNGDEGRGVEQIAKALGWPPRRMNPAINYLVARDLVRSSESIGAYPWCTPWLDKTDKTRRFVRGGKS